MKKLFTIVLGLFLSVASFAGNAQNLEARAELQTKEMAAKLNLNEADYVQLKKINFNRLAKIAALANLREQDHRYLDIRLDQIEEDYNSRLFALLKPAQYQAFADYRKDQPDSYAAVISNNPVTGNKGKAVAITTDK